MKNKIINVFDYNTKPITSLKDSTYFDFKNIVSDLMDKGLEFEITNRPYTISIFIITPVEQ